MASSAPADETLPTNGGFSSLVIRAWAQSVGDRSLRARITASDPLEENVHITLTDDPEIILNTVKEWLTTLSSNRDTGENTAPS